MGISKIDFLAKFSSHAYNKIAVNGAKGLIRLLCFEPQQRVPLHRHPKRDEFFYVVEGMGRIRVGNKEAKLQPSCVVKAPADVPHQWKNGIQRLLQAIVEISSEVVSQA